MTITVTPWRFLAGVNPEDPDPSDETCDAMECLEDPRRIIAIWDRSVTIDGVEFTQVACEKHAIGDREE